MMFVPVAPVTVAAKGNGLGVEHRTNALQDADDVYHQRSMAPGTHVVKGNNLGLVLQPCILKHRPSPALRKPGLFPPETAAAPNTTTQASIIGAGAVLLPAPWSRVDQGPLRCCTKLTTPPSSRGMRDSRQAQPMTFCF